MATALAKKLDNIKDRSGISAREIAQLVRTTPQTVSRWQTGRSSPQRASLDRLLWLEWLSDQLAQFYLPDEARLWLFSRHADLGGERPADLIAEDRMEEVLAILDRMQTGAFS